MKLSSDKFMELLKIEIVVEPPEVPQIGRVNSLFFPFEVRHAILRPDNGTHVPGWVGG